MRAKTFFLALVLLGGCAGSPSSPPTAHVISESPVAGVGLASLLKATVTLARGGFIDDIPKIEELLKLPGMVGTLEWKAPPSWDHTSGGSASFDAGVESPLRNVALEKRREYHDGRRNVLNIIFKRGQCPSIKEVEEAFATTFEVSMIPHHHLALPPSEYRHLDLRATDGRVVAVSVDNDGCAVRLSALAVA